MTIQILPARLANQIAAGEVVERPASAVKELVENSLDSGATRIDIDIEKGGAKLIRVRDNGQGIAKDELTLALSRHATSKIHTLDDLEAISSLGFRGEALASISSVSRLTLTSRPATQEEAWLAYSEGRDMQVKLQPTAHPIGTTVEVLDLFFNTPARRKFLRSEKTEFAHIDELLKRIALSRFDISIHLKHNGKLVRQYRAASTEAQLEKRLSAVCGSAFVRHMLKVELEHEGLKLHGWITTPDGARQQSDLQYCYVNGRMMKDKLINHAIRQSYEMTLSANQYAAYVLYVELDPHQVDVNVHPAKHEVRFHQARLVHDFIYQGIASALAESHHIAAPSITSSAFSDYPPRSSEGESDHAVPRSVMEAVDHTPNYPHKQAWVATVDQAFLADRNGDQATTVNHQGKTTSSSPRQPLAATTERPPSRQEAEVYQRLMSVAHKSEDNPENALPEVAFESGAGHSLSQLGKLIAIVAGQYILSCSNQHYHLVSIPRAVWWKVKQQLNTDHQPVKSQPLLVPLAIKVSQEQCVLIEKISLIFNKIGIELKLRRPDHVTIMGVPQPIRQQNLQKLISELLENINKIQIDSEKDMLEHIRVWISDYIVKNESSLKRDYTLSEAIQLVSELELLFGGKMQLDDPHFVQPVDFSSVIDILNA